MSDHEWVRDLPAGDHAVGPFTPHDDELARRAMALMWGAGAGDFSDWTLEDRRTAALRIHANACSSGGPPDDGYPRVLIPLVAGVRWSRGDLIWSLRGLSTEWGLDDGAAFWVPALIAGTLPPAELTGLSAALESIFDHVKESLIPTRARWQLCEAYGDALDRLTDGLPAKLLHSGDTFGPATRAALGDELAAHGVRDLLLHATTSDKPVPAARWQRRADELWSVTAAGPAAVRAVLRRFAGFGGYLHEDTDVLIRGLTCLLARDESDDVTALLGAVAVGAGSSPARRSGFPFAPKTAAAAVEILVGRSGDEPVKALSRLALTARNKGLQTRVQAALDRLGEARGWAPGEAAELVVEAHGLGADGRRAFTSHGRTAFAEIAGDKARLSIPDGPGSAPPFTDARDLVKEINKTLAIERTRVESLLSQERDWPVADWITRYLEHPVTATWSRRLIWQATDASGATTTGTPERRAHTWFLVGPDGELQVGPPPTQHPAKPGPAAESGPSEIHGSAAGSGSHGVADAAVVDGPGEAVGSAGMRIRLWHPAGASVAEVAGWRDHVVATGLRQPFKQAFREVYPLTPAEEATRVYSNRFAAHILRYRQANALMRTRGWSASYLGTWDGGDHSEATKEFAAGQWRAIFFHELVRDDDPNHYDAEYCATDQVRFARRRGPAWEQAPLDEVPPLVFSEAMRDIDLFVGVTSVATDETWLDRGEERFVEYWRRTATGALTAIAEVRRDALARILPRLAIAARCELTERHLRVHGTRGAYRIHLGSGNILIEPNDAYLCIVVGRAKRPTVQLPFDDDALLSLILSKAILLAADDRITDPTILQQLKHLPDPPMR